MSASHQRESAIFDAAMELPPERRPGYLEEACGGDAALRRRVDSLLQASDSQCVFLDSPARDDQTAALPVSEKPGDIIGRYKLLERIGEGGCGVVYVTEQTQPVRRRVALKIIKVGMDTRSVIARFEAERQALAMMDHPNIAKVLDAGATDTGRPYFVMELVRGVKITEFCDEKKLPPRARLNLFIQVCQAIQHAHQKGIIHRDIKPSNLLVTLNDGVPVPKVIDFGIAKATAGQQLTDKTIYTAFEQFIGTPAYMSPEQAVLTSLDIDTRSDIYALGVLLYELLTGKTPFDAKELLAIGLDEMRRTIREQEPPRPSTRLSTLPGQELGTTAQRRGLDAPKLVSELRGDLDWIVMKALEKDRARRYETANALAADVQRHLNNEPVVACPPSRLYRLQKSVHRNKLAVAAAAAVVIALVIGITASLWQASRARRAEKAAKAAERSAKLERNSAEAILQFVQEKILAAGRPEGMAGGLGKDVTLRKAIDAAESKIVEAFKDRPLVEASIRRTFAESYHYLGEQALAIQQFQRALDLCRQHLGPEHPDTLASVNNLAIAYQEAGKLDQALPLYEETLELRKAKQGPEHPDTLAGMNNLATAYHATGKLDQALALYEATLTLRKAKLGLDHPETLKSMNNLAACYWKVGKVDKALPLYEETLKLRKVKLGPEHYDTLDSMFNLAIAYYETGRREQALSLNEETLKLWKAKLGPDHPRTLMIMNNLAEVYRETGQLDQGLALYEETLKLAKVKLGSDHPHTRLVMKNLADTYRKAGKLDQLEAMYREQLVQHSGSLSARIGLARLLLESAKTNSAKPDRSQELAREGEQLVREYLAGLRSRHTNDPLEVAGMLYDAAELLYRQGNFAEAAPLYQEIIELRRPRVSARQKDLIEPTASLARALSDWAWAERANPQPSTLNSQPSPHERAREAERLLREVLAVYLRESTNSWRVGEVKSRLGGALVSIAVTDPSLNAESREAKLSEAESLLLEGCERVQSRATDDKYKRDALQRLVRFYEALDKPDKCAEWQQKLELFDKAQKKASGSESDAAAVETK